MEQAIPFVYLRPISLGQVVSSLYGLPRASVLGLQAEIDTFWALLFEIGQRLLPERAPP